MRRLLSSEVELLASVACALRRAIPSRKRCGTPGLEAHAPGARPREVARLLVDGVGMQEAPEEKRAGCELPLKIFSKQIATKLSSIRSISP